MTTAIIDYNSGNLRSAEKSFQRMAADPAQIVVTADPDVVARADRIVLPGVGAFADCRAGLLAIDGLFPAIEEAVIAGGKPFLGICVGMQMMAGIGREHGANVPGFDWINGEVVAMQPSDPALKIPHMGWNALKGVTPHPVLDGIGDGAHMYFVHSYHFATTRPADCLARFSHGGDFTAVVGRDNLIGTQFHPEKSQTAGLRLIANFLSWAP